jgi:integrase
MLPLFKPSTQHFLTVTIAQLSLSFGSLKCHDVTTEILQHYVSSLRLSPKTIANRITVFRTVWKSARSWGYVNHDPFDGLMLPKLIPPEPRCFTLEEVTQIIQHSREPYKTLFLLAAETGMRAGEICGLHWREVNLEDRTIAVTSSIWKGQFTSPKTRAGRRVICISQDLADVLRRLGSPRSGTVFTTKLGTPLDPEKVVQRQLRPLLKRLEIAGGGLHGFRHFNATMMDSASVPMKIRQTRLGHSSSQTTLQLYTHALNAEDRKAAVSLSKCIAQDRPVKDAPIFRHTLYWYSSTIGNTFTILPSIRSTTQP